MDNRPLIGHTKTRLPYTQADARIAHFSYMKDEKSRQFAIWQIARQFVGNYFNELQLTEYTGPGAFRNHRIKYRSIFIGFICCFFLRLTFSTIEQT